MPHMPGHTNQDHPSQPLSAIRRGAVNLYNLLQGKGKSLPTLMEMNSRGDRIDPRKQTPAKPPAMGGPAPSVRMPQMNMQPKKTPLIPPGLIPKNPDLLFPYLNSESTKPITMDSLREPAMRGEPIPQALTPSQIIQTSPVVTGKFMSDSVDSAGNPVRRSAANEARRAITPEINKKRRQSRATQRLLEQMKAKNPLPDPSQEPRPRDYFGEQRKNMEDLGMTELQPVAPGMATPQRPQVDESLLSRLPSRSERDRSTMQPGGMGSGDTFDAMAAREREERLAPQRALAQREDVTAEDNEGFTRTVDRDPNSPTFGLAKVVGDPMFGPTVPSEVREFIKADKDLYDGSDESREMRRQLNESREPRRKARLAGKTYTDPETGAVTDYGKFNQYRQRLAEGPTLENMSDARKLRMRRAQLRNYGSTGGVTVAPGGGIGGPLTVGMQRTFGPNMSLNQATAMAQGQLDRESRLRQAEQRKQDAERTEILKSMAEQGDSQAANALRREAGLSVDPNQEVIDKEIESGGIMGGVPGMDGRTFSQVPAAERNLMGLQVRSIIKNDNMNDQQRKQALLRLYPELSTLAGINALQNNTEIFDEFGPQEYLLTEDLKRIMGIKSKPKPSAGPRTPANQGIAPSMPVFM